MRIATRWCRSRKRIVETDGLAAIRPHRHQTKPHTGHPLDRLDVGTRRSREIRDAARVSGQLPPGREAAEHRLDTGDVVGIERWLVELLAVYLVGDAHRHLGQTGE